MPNFATILDAVLILLLAATLFHARRLERALGVLKRDRAVLETLVEGFNDSTRQAEAGIERLHTATDGTGRQIARQIETAQRLRDDLSFLSDRGDRLAERLERTVRGARMLADQPAAPQRYPEFMPDGIAEAAPEPARVRLVPPVSLGDDSGGRNDWRDQPRDTPAATARHYGPAPVYYPPAPMMPPHIIASKPPPVLPAAAATAPRARSQSERDLLRVLRGGR